jgi:hypothetical protein
MVQKHTLTLDNEFITYCKLNNINDIDMFAKQVFNRGFTIIKHGETPKINPLKEDVFIKPEKPTVTEKTKIIDESIENNKIKKNDNLYDE